MTSDRKITIHELYLTYAQRYAEEHRTSVKAVVEALIDEHIVPVLTAKTTGDCDWGELQIAASRLLPPDWNIEPSFNFAPSSSAPPRLLHMISIGDVGIAYVSSEALLQFGDNLQAVAANGGTATLDNAVKLGGAGFYVTRRGNGLMIRPSDDPDGGCAATFASRHVDKLIAAFALMVRSQEEKLRTHY